MMCKYIIEYCYFLTNIDIYLFIFHAENSLCNKTFYIAYSFQSTCAHATKCISIYIYSEAFDNNL